MVGFEEVLVRLYNVAFGTSILFLIAVGLNMIYGVMKVMNLAHTALFALGSYIVAGTVMKIVVDAFGLSPVYLLVIPPVVAGLTALVASASIFPLLDFARGKGEEVQLLLTFGLLLIFEDIFRLVWGANPLRASEPYEALGSVSIGEYTLPLYNVYLIVITLVLVLVLWLLLFRTRIGTLIRAASMDLEMTRALGANATAVLLMVIFLSGFLAGLGGGLYVPAGSAMLGMSIEYLVLAFVVIVIGGLGSFVGALIGSLIVSILRNIALILFPEIELALIYLVAISVLLVKPEGLMGGKRW